MMKEKFLDCVDGINKWIGMIISFLVLVIIGIIIYGVILRYVFNDPPLWTSDMSGLLQLSYIALGGGYTLLHRSHVNVDILYARFSPKNRVVVNLTISSLLFITFIGILMWTGGATALTSIMVRQTTPVIGTWKGAIYPFKCLIPVGAFLLMIQWAANLTRDVSNLKNLRLR